MSATTMTRIVDQCLTMDGYATRLYANLAGGDGRPEMQRFWQTLSDQNARNGSYWAHLRQWAEKGMLDSFFDNPGHVLLELMELKEKVNRLAELSGQVSQMEKAFTVAFKLEFYLLHRAFETLSQYVATFNGNASADFAYERFVSQLFDALQRNNLGTLELELVGEVVHRLWQENQRMAFLSNYDELTGVFNRRGLFNAITHLAHLAQRNQNTVGVLMIDIDHFKAVNDNLGHQVGDSLLRQVAAYIRKGIRASDVLGRYGGEEFLVFLSHVEPAAMRDVGEKIRLSVERMPGAPTPVTISIGVAHGRIGREVEKEIKTLIQQADERLLKAKAAGRNRVEL